MYVDLRALRNDRVSLVERGSPHSLCVMESGKLLPGVKVIIANPETKGQCGDSHLGEVSRTRGSYCIYCWGGCQVFVFMYPGYLFFYFLN